MFKEKLASEMLIRFNMNCITNFNFSVKFKGFIIEGSLIMLTMDEVCL